MKTVINNAEDMHLNPIRTAPQRSRDIAVILPVYRNTEMTRECIESALEGILSVPNTKLLAINDCSPDADMQDMLVRFANEHPGIIIVLSNERNLGFVQTVNRGLAHFRDRDVVLLNSDAFTPANWLARLADDAYSIEKAATVTPLSNNATICGFPNFLQTDPPMPGQSVNDVDRVFALQRLPCIHAPSGVGFCMYIRRDCLDEIGNLNEDKFGRGYGEENDLCQRAITKGWHNLISPNLFVVHSGGESFSVEKELLVAKAMRTIDSLHPNYHGDVQRFIASDPLRSARTTRYLQFLSSTNTPKVLHLSHHLGGGVSQHVEELISSCEDVFHLLLTPADDTTAVLLRLRHENGADNLKLKVPEDLELLRSVLTAINLTAIHYHHTIGFDGELIQVLGALKIPSLMTVHDYYWLNANPTLTNQKGVFEPDRALETANPLYPLPSGETLSSWQARHRSLIENVDLVIYPSTATKALFETCYTPRRSVVAWHTEQKRDVRRPPKPMSYSSNRNIGVIGAIGREKGADLLEAVALHIRESHPNIRFILIGYAYRPLEAVKVSGPYKAQDLPELLMEHSVDALLFPAQWPETYSYTLSYALESGLPIIAPDLGAFPERLSGRANSIVYDYPTSVHALSEQIIAFMTGASGVASARLRASDHDSQFYNDGYYQALRCMVRLDAVDVAPITLLGNYWQRSEEASPIEPGWRNGALRLLWRLYTNRYLVILTSRIPYTIKRRIKRSLSPKPMHEILRTPAK